MSFYAQLSDPYLVGGYKLIAFGDLVINDTIGTPA